MQHAFDRSLGGWPFVLLELRARLFRVGFGDDLPDELVRDAALTRLRDGPGTRARLLDHRDRTVLAGDEDRGGDEHWRFGQGMPFVVGERCFVGHRYSSAGRRSPEP